ncbi:hypothetical protein [Xanthomonas campestris]|uniref:hypothetical protein n=1 Tax=Xanthomonas campestris TaxID=339 RepID=UPI0032E41642
MQFISIVLSQRLIGLGGFVSIQRSDKNTARSHAKISGTIAASGFPALLSPFARMRLDRSNAVDA